MTEAPETVEATWHTWHTDQMRMCPIEVAYKTLGQKFTCLILRDMMAYKYTHFNQFLNHIAGINAKTLSARLRNLESDGLISRKIVHESPLSVEYHLTEKGWAAKPVLDQFVAFATKYEADQLFRDKKSRTFEETLGVKPSFNY
jgi:DNA-binding HxlR family transcriptional regulator